MLLFCVSTALRTARGDVVVLTHTGPIGTPTAEYVERGIDEAEAQRATAVVLRLDTPGGLDNSMRRIILRLMNATVPVVVYVSPRGARAASAGCLIVLAADVAAMAPGTNIGAAHPVYLTGQSVSEKTLNDAAAYARSLAGAHRRNADWAEKAVRENASIAASDALRLKVIDVVASDLADLLRQLDGRVVQTAAGELTLRTADARPVWVKMNWHEQVFSKLANPTLAYLLLVLGILAIIIEVATPGGFLAGTFGAIAVMLAIAGLSNLPVQVSGAALLVLGLGLWVAELKVVSHGFLTLAGLISFVLGSWLLFPRVPGYRVSWLLIGGMSAFCGASLAAVFHLVVKAQRSSPLSGVDGLLQAEGFAKTDLAPRGIVLVRGEDWTAEADPSPIAAGEKVRILEVNGLTLRVCRAAGQRRD